MSQHGYIARLDDTYWSGSGVTWDGVKWTGSSINTFTLTPLTPVQIADASEVRLLLKLAAVNLRRVELHNGAGATLREWILPGDANKYAVFRFFFGVTITSLRFVWAGTSDIEIPEIEVGYNGTF